MRKSAVVQIPNEWGARDAGKIFKITEMPAHQAEKWAIRGLLLIRNTGARIPDGVDGLGMEGIFIIGLNIFLQGSIAFEDMEPLLDEMMTCVEIIRDKAHPNVVTPIVSPDDIEEVKTRAWLRSEVLKLHTGFSPADALFALISAIQTSPSESTPTSPPK